VYVLVVGYGAYWDDGIHKVLGPFTEQEAADMEKYYDSYSCVRTEIFELTKEL
jgi:hypothetical protein